METLVAFLALGGLTFWANHDDNLQILYQARWFICLFGCALLLSWRVGRRVSWGLVPLVLSVSFSGLSGAFLYDSYSNLPIVAQLGIKADAAGSLVCFLFMALAVWSLNYAQLRGLQRALAMLGPCAAGVALVFLAVGKNENLWERVPFVDNPSLFGSLLVVCLHFTLHGYRNYRLLPWLYALVMVFAMVLLKVSTPMVALLGSMAVLCAKAVPKIWRHEDAKGRALFLSALVGIMAIPVAMALWVAPWAMWSYHSERWTIWKMGTDIMSLQAWQVRLLGTGLGSTHLILPLWQDHVGYKGPMYFTFHNDWLQLWVEQGLLGLVAAVTALAAVVMRTWSRPHLLGAVVAYSLSMVFNFTTHWPLQAFLGVVLVRLAYEDI